MVACADGVRSVPQHDGAIVHFLHVSGWPKQVPFAFNRFKYAVIVRHHAAQINWNDYFCSLRNGVGHLFRIDEK